MVKAESLLRAARRAQKHAHAPYSRFRVGAVVQTARGTLYTGCNIENSSYGLTICAERTALFKAISAGERRFTAIAVVADEKGYTSPCGACRQVIWDLAGNVDVIMSNGSGDMRIVKMIDLLPHPFGPENLKSRVRRKS